MAYYFIATALAAVTTLSSALPLEDDSGDIPAEPGKANVTLTEKIIVKACPHPYWRRNNEYHVYPYKYDVHKYYNCGQQTTLETCPDSLVFDTKMHYCTQDFETSRNFKCPRFVTTYKMHKRFADPNFPNQYHKCWGFNILKTQRHACPYNGIFEQSRGICVEI